MFRKKKKSKSLALLFTKNLNLFWDLPKNEILYKDSVLKSFMPFLLLKHYANIYVYVSIPTLYGEFLSQKKSTPQIIFKRIHWYDGKQVKANNGHQ